MQITIASVGKLKEKYWNDALAEFQKDYQHILSLIL